MLTPEQVAALRDKAGRITDSVTDFLLEDIARRISEAGQLTSTAAYQVWRAQQLGVSRKEIKKELRKRLKVSQKEIEQLLTQSAEVGYNFDLKRLPHAQAVPFEQSESLQQIVAAAVELAQEDFTNLTQRVNPKFCVNSIWGANRAKFIQGGSRGIRLPPCQQHNAGGVGCQGQRSCSACP